MKALLIASLLLMSALHCHAAVPGVVQVHCPVPCLCLTLLSWQRSVLTPAMVRCVCPQLFPSNVLCVCTGTCAVCCATARRVHS